MGFISDLSDTIKLFLDKKIAQNGRLLLSLIITIAFLLLFHNKPIFIKIKADYGKVGIGICILLFWLILFITINLIANKLSNNRRLRRQRKAELKRKEQNIIEIYDNLDSLSESQKSLLERFVLENKRQFQDYEIGGYKAVWGRDIEVLQAKGIIKTLTYGLYEINKKYFNLIKEHFNINGSGEELPQ